MLHLRRLFGATRTIAFMMALCSVVQMPAADDPSGWVWKSAVARIVDPDGKPLPGAKVTPWALRARGHGSWNEDVYGKPKTTLSDAEGMATVEFPSTAWENPVTEISLVVDHADFCVKNVELSATSGRGKELGQFPLERGTILRLQAFDSIAAAPTERVFIQLLTGATILPRGKVSLFDLDTDERVKGQNWYVSRPLPPVANRLVAVVMKEDEPPLFSEVIRWSPDRPASQVILTTVNAGTRVEGRIDDQPARPIRNGHVMAFATSAPQESGENSHCAAWRDIVEIAPDGSFVFPSLPRGCDLQFVAVCDGWRSASPTAEEQKILTTKYGGLPPDSRSYPQTLFLEGDVVSRRVPMTPTTAIRVKCVDSDGRPQPGLDVGASPNHYICGVGSWLFGVTIRTADFLKTGSYSPTKEDRTYWGITGSDGIAVVKNLPPGRDSVGVREGKRFLKVNGESEFSFEAVAGTMIDVNVTVTRPDTAPSR